MYIFTYYTFILINICNVGYHNEQTMNVLMLTCNYISLLLILYKWPDNEIIN